LSVAASLLQSDRTTPGARPERRQVGDWVLRRLYEGIFNGEYAAGQSLSEAELCAQLGVSRQPVREALRQLEADGLIATSAGNGARAVVAFNRDHLIELYEVRSALEALTSRRAATLITEAQLKELGQLRVEFEESLESEYDATPDFRFHQVVAEASGMPQVTSFLVTVWIKTWALLNQLDIAGTYPTASDRSGAWDDRAEVMAALRARDGEAAAAAAEKHIRHRMEDILDALDSGRGTFRLPERTRPPKQ